MMPASRRIYALIYRHVALFRRSWPRLLEVAYWPTLQLLIWGFTASFFAHSAASITSHLGQPILATSALIAGVLLWEFTIRSQIGVTLSFMEEIWSRNLGHLFVSPLRPGEFLSALIIVSLLRTIIGLLPALIIAYALYSFNILLLGPVLVLFLANLLIMGWWIALLIVSLLFRYGAGAEALAWTVGFAIAPFACVFYPLAALPAWLAPIAIALPAAHIFAGMRAALLTQTIDWHELNLAFLLNGLWACLAFAIFAAQFRAARIKGALISIGE
jgi:ABC-2 type transport system permease protein